MREIAKDIKKPAAPKPTTERIVLPGEKRVRVVYRGVKGGLYFKKDGVYVAIKKSQQGERMPAAGGAPAEYAGTINGNFIDTAGSLSPELHTFYIEKHNGEYRLLGYPLNMRKYTPVEAIKEKPKPNTYYDIIDEDNRRIITTEYLKPFYQANRERVISHTTNKGTVELLPSILLSTEQEGARTLIAFKPLIIHVQEPLDEHVPRGPLATAATAVKSARSASAPRTASTDNVTLDFVRGRG